MLHWVVLTQCGFKVFKACDALNDTQCVSLGLKHVIITKLKCIFFFLCPKENFSVKCRRVTDVKTLQAPQNMCKLAYWSKYRPKS